MCCVGWCAREVCELIVYVVAAVFFFTSKMLVFVLMAERL